MSLSVPKTCCLVQLTQHNKFQGQGISNTLAKATSSRRPPKVTITAFPMEVAVKLCLISYRQGEDGSLPG